MANDPITLNEDDPCTTAAALAQAYATLVAGGRPSEIVFKAGANGVDQRMTMHAADAQRLFALVREWQAKCVKAQGGRSSRRVFRAGGWR